jgi:outer membrane protein OmpA-like peptidoglycan-associated protein
MLAGLQACGKPESTAAGNRTRTSLYQFCSGTFLLFASVYCLPFFLTFMAASSSAADQEILPMTTVNGSFTRAGATKVCALLLTIVALTSVAVAQTFTSGEKGKVKGTIVSRKGDLVKVQDAKTGAMAIVKITDDTKIIRDKSKVSFHRHEDMDVTAMVPGLTINAEGVGNADNQLEASKISFSPDAFAIEVAQQQEINANKSAAGSAQKTANQGVTAAGAAQSSANQAQTTADAAGTVATAAGAVAITNAAAVQMVNKRVSDLDDYQTVAEAVIYYPTGKYALDDAAKADLDKLTALAASTDGYLIEIAGYASKTGTKQANQQLSEDRASAVANYLRNTGNIPMRRIVAPAGYGATHPDAANTDPQGRELNRRVDVKLIVNKGFQAGM